MPARRVADQHVANTIAPRLKASSTTVAAGRPGSRDSDRSDSRTGSGARVERRLMARRSGGIDVASRSAATNASAGGSRTTIGLLTDRASAAASSGPVLASCQASTTMAVSTIATIVRTPPPQDRPGAVASTVVTIATTMTTTAAASGLRPSVAPARMAPTSVPAQPARMATTRAPPIQPRMPPSTAGMAASRTRNRIRSRRRAPTAVSRATSAATSSRTTSARNTANASRIATPREPMRSSRADAASACPSATAIIVSGLSTLYAASAAVRSRVRSSTAPWKEAAVHGWTAPTSTGAVHTYVRPVRSKAGALEIASTPSTMSTAGLAPAGLVVAATDRDLAERAALVERTEGDGGIDQASADDRQFEVRRGPRRREVELRRGLGQEQRLAGPAVDARGGEPPVDQCHEGCRVVDADHELEHGQFEVLEFARHHAASRRMGQAAEMCRDRLFTAVRHRLVVRGGRSEARDPDQRPIHPCPVERARDGRIRRHQPDARHDGDQGGRRADGRHRDQGGRTTSTEAGEDERRDRAGHPRMVTYQRR